MQCCLVRRVVAEFRPRKLAEPATWTITGETTQVDTEDLVGDLRLAVDLQTKSRVEADLHTREGEELLPKGVGETGS